VSAALAQTAAKVYPIKDVSEFVSGGNTTIDIVQSDSEYLRVEADTEVMDRIKVDQTNQRLSVWVKSGKGGFFDWFVHGKEPVKIILHVKQLLYLELSGGALAKVGDLNGLELNMEASGAVKVQFSQLTMERVNMGVSGAANVGIQYINAKEQRYGISGASVMEIKEDSFGDRLDVDASGASKFSGEKLVVKKAALNASGASHINATVTESLNADASGASNITYYGSPRSKTKATGASHVNARE
jgi:hypothetical protein